MNFINSELDWVNIIKLIRQLQKVAKSLPIPLITENEQILPSNTIESPEEGIDDLLKEYSDRVLTQREIEFLKSLL